jgi:hypothetical protein
MVLDIQTIYMLVLSALPTIINIIALIVGLKKIFNKTTDIEVVKSQYSVMHKENIKLRKQINELLTKIDHVERRD